MKIQRDRFYFYAGTAKSEARFAWDFELSRPGYWWLLWDICVFYRVLEISLRIGSRPGTTRRHFSGDSSDFSTPHCYKPVKFDSDAWTEWEL